MWDVWVSEEVNNQSIQASWQIFGKSSDGVVLIRHTRPRICACLNMRSGFGKRDTRLTTMIHPAHIDPE